MASKQPVRLFNIRNKLYVWSTRMVRFFQNRILHKRKNILLVGQYDNPLSAILTDKLGNTSEIYCLNLLTTKNSTAEKHTSLGSHIHYMKSQNMQQIEAFFEKKQFDSIVVLPQLYEQKRAFSCDEYLGEQIKFIQEKLLQSVKAYRLASKYLTTTGVFILSNTQSDFLKMGDKLNEFARESNKSSQDHPLTLALSSKNYLLEAQINYLGVVVGERDYTDLSSWALVALSEEAMIKDMDYVGSMYNDWVQGTQLPMPGSFALFKKEAKSKFVEYL